MDDACVETVNALVVFEGITLISIRSCMHFWSRQYFTSSTVHVSSICSIFFSLQR